MGATFSGTSSKRVKTSNDVLDNDSMLKHIFGYVGTGHWLFLAKVSKRWKHLYSGMPPVNLQSRYYGWAITVSCCSKQTLGSAVFGNTNTLRLAYDSGLELSNAAGNIFHPLYHRRLLTRAGEYADISTLQLAHSLGMPWTKEVAVGVALSKSLAKLQWLYPQLHFINDDDDDPPDSEDSSDEESDDEIARPKKIRGWRSTHLLVCAAAYGSLDI
eukprot:1611-Heterococcus_DN1.PRE.2